MGAIASGGVRGAQRRRRARLGHLAGGRSSVVARARAAASWSGASGRTAEDRPPPDVARHGRRSWSTTAWRPARPCGPRSPRCARLAPARIVVAVPAAPESTCRGAAPPRSTRWSARRTPSPFLRGGRARTGTSPRPPTRRSATLLPAAAASRPTAERVTIRVRSRAVLRRGAGAAASTAGVTGDDALLDLVGDARFVLLGEASHGTHEFYASAPGITRRLIERAAASAPWRSRPTGPTRTGSTATSAAGATMPTPRRRCATSSASRPGCGATPSSLDFVGWLRAHNDRIGRRRAREGRLLRPGPLQPAPLHGRGRLPTSSASTRGAADRARERYACFDHVRRGGPDLRVRGGASAPATSCEREVIEQLVDLQRHAAGVRPPSDGPSAADDAVLRRAERPHRARTPRSTTGRCSAGGRRRGTCATGTWSTPSTRLIGHLGTQRGEAAKVVVWAHNSHLGDARATEVGRAGRAQRRPAGPRAPRRRLPPDRLHHVHGHRDGRRRLGRSRPNASGSGRRCHGSYERLFHEAGRDRLFWLTLRAPPPELTELLRSPRLERAIGVIYRPRTERQSHYFQARLVDQFDAVVHIDETRARRAAGAQRPVGGG